MPLGPPPQAGKDEPATPGTDSAVTQRLLELSGDERPEEATTLIARQMGLTTVGPLSAFTDLEVLSLSHNLLTSLAGCDLSRLVSLNVSFNRIASLGPLSSCQRLTHLFASNNRIACLAPLVRCPLLVAVSLYRNELASLDNALSSLSRLANLAELDLGSNPCSAGQEEYVRHRTLHKLRRLSVLDGDTVTPFDHELVAGDEPSLAAPRASRLFRDPFLDSNPILMQYLAEAEASRAHACGSAGAEPSGEATPHSDTKGVSSVLTLRRPMVERLRLTAATMEAASQAGTDAAQLASQPMFTSGDDAPDKSAETHRVRSLLLSVQQLTLERDEARAGRSRAVAEAAAAAAELEMLKREHQQLRSLLDQAPAITILSTSPTEPG